MNRKHKWCDVIVAWANGEKIQVKLNDGSWGDVGENSNHTPLFHYVKYDWRIKPRLTRYRMARLREDGKEYITAVNIDKYNQESVEGFVCWVGEVTEVVTLLNGD